MFIFEYIYKRKSYNDNHNVRVLRENSIQNYIVFNSPEYQLLVWGVVYGKNLASSIDTPLTAELIIDLYMKSDIDFQDKLEGRYSLILIDKRRSITKIVTDRANTKPLFLFESNDIVIVSNNYIHILKKIKECGLSYTISLSGCYQLLTFGYMLGNNTIHEDISKVKPGTILNISTHGLIEKRYHMYSNESKIDDLDYSLNSIDDILSKAIQRDIDLNNYKQRKHLVTLSGGLDSRVVYYLLKRNNTENCVHFTYAAKDSLDARISLELAEINNDNILFYPLDNCKSITDWEKPIQSNFGLVNYYGTTGLPFVLNNINSSNFFVMHTGGLGEGGFGGYLQGPSHTNKAIDLFNKDRVLISRFKDDYLNEYSKYPNDELFVFYNRAVNGMINAFLIGNPILEVSSIFLNEDFLTLAFHTSPELRYKRMLLENYILKKLPEADKTIVEKYGCRLSDSHLKKKSIRIKWAIQRRLTGKTASMNPFEYWYKKNSDFRLFLNDSYSEHETLVQDRQLQDDLHMLFSSENISDRLRVVSLLKALSFYSKL